MTALKESTPRLVAPGNADARDDVPTVVDACDAFASDLVEVVPHVARLIERAADLLRAVGRHVAGVEATTRVLVRDVKSRYGVGPDWAWARAREGALTIYGPRGARYVKRAELERALETSTVKPRRRREDDALSTRAVLAEVDDEIARVAARVRKAG